MGYLNERDILPDFGLLQCRGAAAFGVIQIVFTCCTRTVCTTTDMGRHGRALPENEKNLMRSLEIGFMIDRLCWWCLST